MSESSKKGWGYVLDDNGLAFFKNGSLYCSFQSKRGFASPNSRQTAVFLFDIAKGLFEFDSEMTEEEGKAFLKMISEIADKLSRASNTP